MELRQYVTLLWQRCWLILLGAACAGTAAYFYNQAQPAIYRATATLLVNQGNTDLAGDYRALLVSERLALSYVERLTNYEVLSQAIENLQLEMQPGYLKRNVHVNLIGDTQLIALYVEHTDPQIASALANEIPEVFAARNSAQQLERFAASKASLETELTELQVELKTAESSLETELSRPQPDQANIDQASDHLLRLRETYARLLQSYEDVRIAEASNLNNIIIDEFARPPAAPIRPKILTNTLLAATVGATLAVGIIFLAAYFDDTIKNPQEIEQLTSLSPLGVIRHLKIKKSSDALVVATAPRSPAAEAYRQVRTNIQFIGVDHEFKTLLVTSPNVGDGKSTIATNVAIALAQSGKRVILVDADMRRPSLHQLLEVSGARGLSNVIMRGQEDETFIKGTLINHLRLLPAGRLPPNPAELLGSERMKKIIAWLQEEADHVIFDSPPLLAVTDAAVLSQLVDTTLLVVSAHQTRYPAFMEAVRKLLSIDSHIAGVILNKAPVGRHHGYYYDYYSHDDSTNQPANGRKSWRQWFQASVRSGSSG